MQHKHYHVGDWVAFYGNTSIRIRSSIDGKLRGLSLMLKALPPKTQIAMLEAYRERKLPNK